jgi:hypothetical protein
MTHIFFIDQTHQMQILFRFLSLVVMIFAGIVLFGGSYFSMRALLKADAE